MSSDSQRCVTFGDRPENRLTREEKALFAAVRKSDVKKTRQLIETGVNVNALETPDRMFEFNFTPLHWAALNQDVPMVKLLLEAGANVHAEVSHLQAMGHPGEPPLNWACGFRRSEKPLSLDVVRLLLQNGANPNHRMTTSRQSVFEASILKGRIQLAKLLLDAGANVNPEIHGVASPLM